MDIYHHTDPSTPQQVMAVGTFDGVHRGHQYLINMARKRAENRGLLLSVLTFEPDPRFVLDDLDPTDRRLLAPSDKQIVLEQQGVDILYEIPFDEEFASLSAGEFVDRYFKDEIPLDVLFVGSNFQFGQDRQGSPDMLDQWLSSTEVGLETVEPLREEGEVISSTRIRNALRDGRPRSAYELLGRSYIVRDTIVKGDGRGREIGFPTVNIPVTRTIHPRFGVYAVWLETRRGLSRSVANFGRRPTVDGQEDPVLEVHALDADPDVPYGREVRVYFEEFIRGEREFDSVGELSQQIERDVQSAREIHGSQDRPEPLEPTNSVL